MRPEDQEVLGFLQQHGENAFAPLAQKWGISRQAARQRVYGVRDRDGKVRQVGIVDRIANTFARYGLTPEDVFKAYQPRVYESDAARTGLSPKLNEAKFQEEGLSDESPVEQGTGTVASPGGSQSDVQETAHERKLAEQVPGYAEKVAAERNQQPGEQAVEHIPAAQGEKVDDRIAEREAHSQAYGRAQQWWDHERDNSPQIPSFEDLSDRHQEEVIDAVGKGEANGRLQKRIVGEFNEPSYFSKGRPFSEEERLNPGIQRGLRELLDAKLFPLMNLIRGGVSVANIKGDGGMRRIGPGNYRLYFSPALLKDGSETYTAHVFRHEMAHVEDVELGGYSQGERFAQVLPDVYKLAARKWGGDYLSYPFNDKGEMNELVFRAEVYAQLRALWLDKNVAGSNRSGQAIIQRDAPSVAAFMREVDTDVQASLKSETGAAQATAGSNELRATAEGHEALRRRADLDHPAFQGAQGKTPAAAKVTLSVLQREAARITDPKNRALVEQFVRSLSGDVDRGNFKGAVDYVSMVLRDNQQSTRTPGIPDFTTPQTREMWQFVNKLVSEIKSATSALSSKGKPFAEKSIDEFKQDLKTMPDADLTETAKMMKEAREQNPSKENTERWTATLAEVNSRDKARLFNDVQDKYGDGGETPPTLQSRGKPFEEAQRQATTRVADAWAKVKPTLLTLHQLVDQFGDKLTGLKTYTESLDKMEQRHHEILNRAHKVILDWQKIKDTRTRDQLNRVMMQATMKGIHPDEAFGSAENAHITDQGEYDALKRQYDALPQQAKDVYQAVRKMLEQNWDARKKAFARSTTGAYAKLIADAGTDQKRVAELTKERDTLIRDHEKAIADIKGPYFPLLRFGDYLTIAKSKDYLATEKALEDATGADRTALQKKLDAMKKQSQHYVVEAHENSGLKSGRYAAEQSAAQYNARGMEARAQLAEEHLKQLQPIAAGAIDKISSGISDQFDKQTAAKLKQLVTELYISSLPEHAALQRTLKRKGVEGAAQDMLRSVAKNVEKDAFYLARLEYADQVADNLFKLKQEAKKAGIDYQHVYNNVAARMALDFEYKPTPVQNFLARMSGIWHLGMSPAYLLTNATQPWMITAPVLAGRFGAGRSFAALRSAWVDAANIIKQSKSGGAFADIDFKGMRDPQEREMLERVVSRGQIDINQNVDMGLVADGTDPKYLKFQKAFNWANQQIEASNRITTALAAYRLARHRGQSHDDAADFAYKAVVDTQLDYSNANAAYWMKSGAVPLGKLIFQFRKYQQGMIYLMARNAQLAFKGDKDALRALGYLGAMQLAFAGATGIPVAMLPLAAMKKLWPDDDEKGDPETQLRNFLADTMGEDAARALWKGLPTLVGLDVSQRVGMGDFWNPVPYLRLTGKTGSDDMGQLLLQTLGAPFGTLANFWDAGKFFEKGDWGKGIEKMLPKMLADPLKAARYSNEGITTRSGNQVLHPDKIDGWDIALRAAGFQPTVESEHYSAQSAKTGTAQAIQDRRSNVLAKYAQAKVEGKDTAGALEAINAFNQDHPTRGYRIDRSAMLKAVQSRKTGGKQLDEAGVGFSKQDRALRGIDRFAYGA